MIFAGFYEPRQKNDNLCLLESVIYMHHHASNFSIFKFGLMILIRIQLEILKIEADLMQLCRKRRGTSRELNLIGPFLAFHQGAQNG